MADMKKYLSTEGLSALVDQIKAEDAKVLAAAKKYTDDAGKLYDAAGSAATAESNAKAYTDELANGQVKANKEAIEKLNGDATTEGSVAKAVADAKAVIDADVDAVEGVANQNKADIAAINNAETGILAQAKNFATEEDAKVLAEVGKLSTYVGTIPETAEATNIVAYVQEKTAGIATDTALEELTGRVAQAETDIDNIEKDYLKAADKTALEEQITAVQDAVAGEAATARAAEEANAAAIKAISDDYLKAADKTELEGKINAKADQTALDAEVEAREGAIAGLQTQINTIMNNPDAEGAINSINEFTTWVNEHGTVAEGMRTDINKNKDDIAALDTAYKAADTAMNTRVEALEAIDHDAYVAADTALKNELTTEIGKKADTSALTEAVTALEGVDAGHARRIEALEAKFGEGDGNVEDMIATAKQEAIDAAAGDATTKANAAETNAKGYADGLNTAMNARVEALEAIDHAHKNLDLLETYTQTEADLADAVAKKHEHSNLAVLEDITAAKVTAWDAAEQNAKTYADGLNTDMTTKVDGIAGKVTALETASATHALDSDLDAAVERIAANETAIAANTSAINSFTAITADEVNALFA